MILAVLLSKIKIWGQWLYSWGPRMLVTLIMKVRMSSAPPLPHNSMTTGLPPPQYVKQLLTECLTDQDATTGYTTCLQAIYDPSTICIQYLTGRDVSQLPTVPLVYGLQLTMTSQPIAHIQCLPDVQCVL